MEFIIHIITNFKEKSTEQHTFFTLIAIHFSNLVMIHKYLHCYY